MGNRVIAVIARDRVIGARETTETRRKIWLGEVFLSQDHSADGRELTDFRIFMFCTIPGCGRLFVQSAKLPSYSIV